MSGAPFVSVQDLRKSFRRSAGAEVRAVNGISFDVAAGEMVAIVGPSGCGKTSLLRCIAGLERPSSGKIVLGGTTVSGDHGDPFIPPEDRGIGMMFQSYALWPHMTVFQNVAYPLRRIRVPRAEIAERVDDVLQRVGLAGLRDEAPGHLSGGQQQRVALARSLVAAPGVILFDEPLSNVDAKVREELRLELVQMHRDFGFAGLYVTHDQDDAMQVCDRLIVLREGEIAQSGSPIAVYGRPNSCYVAEFVGVANKLDGRRATDSPSGSIRVETAIGSLSVVLDEWTPDDQDVAVLGRPHQVILHSQRPTHQSVNIFEGAILGRMFMGARVQYLVTIGDTVIRAWASAGAFELNQRVWVSIDPAALLVRRREDRAA